MRVLFQPMHPGALAEMVILGRYFRACGWATPVFLLEQNLASRAPGLLDDGFEVHCSSVNGRRSRLRFVASLLRRGALRRVSPERLVGRLQATSIMHGLVVERLEKQLRCLRQHAREMLDRHRPDVVVVSGDRHWGLELPLLRSAAAECTSEPHPARRPWHPRSSFLSPRNWTPA